MAAGAALAAKRGRRSKSSLKGASKQMEKSMSEKQLAREIRQLEKRMLEHARNLEFEKAALVRDQLAQVKRSFFGALPEDEEKMRAVG